MSLSNTVAVQKAEPLAWYELINSNTKIKVYLTPVWYLSTFYMCVRSGNRGLHGSLHGSKGNAEKVTPTNFGKDDLAAGAAIELTWSCFKRVRKLAPGLRSGHLRIPFPPPRTLFFSSTQLPRLSTAAETFDGSDSWQRDAQQTALRELSITSSGDTD